MKKLLFIAVAALLAAGSISAAKTVDQVRFYLNPGHGSWGPNDRPMATIPYPMLANGMPDTCGFYESNTNLWKVLKLGKTLEKLGVKPENIMYSRVKNGPYPYVKGAADEDLYNRSLSEICYEVDANNMDMFLSVHSNAASEGTTTNYPLYIYRGNDGEGGDSVATSRDMAKTVWPGFYTNALDPMTAYGPADMNIRGDISFYGSSSTRTDTITGKKYTGYLGVLKHGAPGFLSEGYFHTYQPARHRALNIDYCGQEGVRYARGIAKYFGFTPESTGYIMGTVKDLHEKIVNNLFKYAPNTNDQWLPLNGAVVTLYKAGTKVADYTVDNNYNGIFVFENLAPGNDYTLDCTMAGYKALADTYKAPIKVTANETTYPMIYMESESYVPPKVTYYNYPDPVQPSYLKVAKKFNMNQEFVNKSASVLYGKSIRRSILRGDSLYVLALDTVNKANTPHLYIINPETQAVVKELSTEGTVGSELALSDIAFTSDNVLVGCNLGKTAYNGTTGFNVYKWNLDSLDKAPKAWISTGALASGNFGSALSGKSLAISGNSNQCTLITTAETTGSTHQFRLAVISIDGGILATGIRNQDAAKFTVPLVGEDYHLTVSPRNDTTFILDGSLITPLEFKLNSTNAQAPTYIGQMSEDLISKTANGANYFKYAKHALMVAPVADAMGKNVGVKLFDITDGLDKATAIETTNTTLEAGQANSIMAGALVANEDISLYLAKDSLVSKFTTLNVAQPKVKGIYAYNLNVTANQDKTYTFTFTANSDAQQASIIFTDKASGNQVCEISVPNVKEGANTVTIADADITATQGADLNWAVKLVGNPIATIQRLNEATADNTYTRAFVAVDKSPESSYFGRIYVTDRVSNNNAANGLYAYNPDWTRINSAPYTGGQTFGSNYRIGIDAAGTVYIPDWSDPHSGIFIADPAHLDGSFTQFFEGTRNGDGKFSNNGVDVGGSSPSVFILGQGANTKLFTYSEDLGSGNNIAIYNIGSDTGIAKTWGVAPNGSYEISSLQANTNGNVVADETEGCWVAQTRGAGNNLPGVPSLIYVNNQGNVTFNSGNTINETLTGTWGSGFAVTKDDKMLVINDGEGKLQFYDVTWTTEDTPSLTYKYSYNSGITDAGKNVYEMAFDYAGNLVATGAQLGIFSMPTDNNESTVPAKAILAIKKLTSGIANVNENVKLAAYPNPTTASITISAPEAIKAVKIFSATGSLVAESNSASVDMSNLAAGIYIVKVNNLKAIQVIKK